MEDSTTTNAQDATPQADTDWLQIAQAAWDQSTNYFDSSIRKDIERDLRQFQSLHPRDSKYLNDAYLGRAKFFRPKTRAAIRKNEAAAAAAIFANADVVSIDPEDQDDKQEVAGALFMNELVNIRLRKTIPWFQLSMGAYQDTQSVGVCISHQYWLYDKERGIDEPRCDLLPIENFRFSPAANWTDPVNTSPYVIEIIPMYVKDIRAKAANDDTKSESKKWNKCSAKELMLASMEYMDSIALQRQHGRTDDKSQQIAVNDYTTVWVRKYIVEIDGEDYIYYTLANVKLLSEPVKLDTVYFHGMRPYVLGNCVIETHKVYPSGVSRLTRDVQGELNQNANQRLDNVNFAMNKRYFVKRGVQVDLRSLHRNVPSSVTLMLDPEKDVKIVETKDVTASAYQEQDRLNLDYDDIAGSFSSASINANKNMNETVGGMEMISADASQLGNYQMKTFGETWMKPVISQLVALEAHYETDERILKLAGRKANLVSDHGINTVDDELLSTPVQVSIHIGIGATTPQKRLNNFLFALKSLKDILSDEVLMQSGLDLEAVTEEVFSKLGYDSGSRFFDMDGNPQVKQLNAQIQQLQQQLANKSEPPELVAAKVALLTAQAGTEGGKSGLMNSQSSLAQQQLEKVKAEKVKLGVDAIFAGMQAAEVVAAVPTVAPVADNIMRAAGYESPIPVGIMPDLGGPTLNQPPAAAQAAAMAPAPDPSAPPALPPQGAVAATAGRDMGTPSAAPGLQSIPIKNRKIGTQFTPGGPQTNPLVPPAPVAPATPGTGEEHGIETPQFDSGAPQH